MGTVFFFLLSTVFPLTRFFLIFIFFSYYNFNKYYYKEIICNEKISKRVFIRNT